MPGKNNLGLLCKSQDIVGPRELFQTVKSYIDLGGSRVVSLEHLVSTGERDHQAVLRSEKVTGGAGKPASTDCKIN